jgi:hypothetical protein
MGAMHAPQPSTFSWRFTLRELFLAILAIAAFLGWGLSIYRDAYQQRTPFFDNWDAEVKEAIDNFGEPQFPLEEEGFGQLGKGSGYYYEQYKFKLAASQTNAFMDAYQKRIRDRMTTYQCAVDDENKGFDHGGGQWFWIGYHRNALAGSARVSIAPLPMDEARLSILIYEGRKP